MSGEFGNVGAFGNVVFG